VEKNNQVAAVLAAKNRIAAATYRITLAVAVYYMYIPKKDWLIKMVKLSPDE